MERPILNVAAKLSQVVDLALVEEDRDEALRLLSECCVWAYLVHYSEWLEQPGSALLARETLANCEGRLHGFLERCQKAPAPASAARCAKQCAAPDQSPKAGKESEG